MSSISLRRSLLLLAAGAVLWSGVVAITGGFTIGDSALGISSHHPFRPFLAALILTGIYLTFHGEHLDVDILAVAHLPWPRIIGTFCAFAALTIGIACSSFIAAGPDQSGYVSQADKWAHGQLTTPIPEWAQRTRWTRAADTAQPTGYIPDPRRTSFVPTYAPGLPLVMAAFQRLGGPDAVFYVVPLFGALTIWMTYVLGVRLGGPWGGALAAALMLSSPAFLWILLQPMSDVPATACWITAIVVAWQGRSRDAIVSGLVTALAVVIRPNLVPLAAVPAMLLLTSPDARVRRLAIFGVAVMPGVLLMATLNARWYGSALNSGYGSLDNLYSFTRVLPNLERYGGWFVTTQTPLAFLWLSAPFVLRAERAEWVRIAIVTLVCPLAVFAMYATYLPWDSWAYLRFLLPAFPAVCAGLGAIATALVRSVRPRSVALAVVAAVTTSIAIQQWTFVTSAGLFQQARVERRFARANDFVRKLPANAILISDLYSGTLHFYTDRDVLRWGFVDPRQFDLAVRLLHDDGHRLYFIGDAFEERAFKNYMYTTAAADRFDSGRVPDGGDGFVASDLTPP